jgi:alpha/beta superfamily hydrolase
MNDPTIVTDDGVSLEAVLTTTGDSRGAIVLCHPHPQHGGTMRAPILEAITLEAARRGFDILRFNFRGIGRSTGSHGFGNDEIADVDGAVTWMTQRTVPVVGIAGWSFGAAVALNWQSFARSGLAYVGIAPPVDSPLSPALPAPSDLVPARRTFIVGDRDQFLDADELASYANSIDAETVRYTTADHFFVLRHDRLATDVLDAIDW